MAKQKTDIRSLSSDELAALVADCGEAAFRAKQLEEWLWVKDAASFEEMSNLSKGFRTKLDEGFSCERPLEALRLESVDGSRKYLLEFADGVRVECVGMPSSSKLSVCVSTQAGCAMACAFCATGKLGLTRSLEAHEIVQQVLHVQRDFDMKATSVVFMGQGEPFANYDATLAALRRLNSKLGCNIGARHLTVSTCGLIPGITRFASEPEQFTLAVSLHSALQATRNKLMPAVKRFSLVHLHAAMVDYADKTGRRPSYEYALIAGVNDGPAALEALCSFCKGTLAHVNLIQLNDVEGSPFKPSSDARAGEFIRGLAAVGVEATLRKSRGSDIDAACGQLAFRAR